MILGHRCTTAIIIGKQRHRISSTIAASPAISGGGRGGRCALARALRAVAFPPLLISLAPPPPRAVRPMSKTPCPRPPPPWERSEEEVAPAKEESRESAPSSDSPPSTAAAAAAPLPPPPPPPEMPSPGDCCGSGCVRCVWDIYYDELEAYNKLIAERRPETKKVD